MCRVVMTIQAMMAVLCLHAGETNMADVAALQTRIRDLEKEIKQLSAQMKTEKYGLRWVPCPEAFEAESENKIPILTEVPEKAISNKDGKPTHILIEGDNYHALTCLNFTHRGRIDVIYIDPPYNTGSDGFTYKDKRFLEKYPDGEVIGKDHPLRHSAWLSFMSKRLKLAKDLLSNRGVIFISVDDNEMANLKLLCDDPKLFGEKNFIGNIDWESKTKSQNTESAYDKLQPKVEHILVYALRGRNHFNLTVVGKHQYDESDARGKYRDYQVEVMAADGVRGRETMVFPILGVNPPAGQQWKLGFDKIKEFEARGDLFLDEGWPHVRMRPGDERAEITEPFWGFIPKEIGTAESAKKELTSIIGKHGFETVKPVDLVKKLIFHASYSDSVVLDFFAGSGTSLQAVGQLNADDGGRRTCIICTDNENNICTDITYPRVSKIIKGYTSKKSEARELFKESLSLSALKHSDELLEKINVAKTQFGPKNVEVKFVDGAVVVKRKQAKNAKVSPLGGSLKYYKTDFVGKHCCAEALDEDRALLAAKAGTLLAMAEETLEDVKVTKKDAKFWQHFSDGAHRHTMIYFSDDLSGFASLVEKAEQVRTKDKAAKIAVYVFTIGSVEGFENEFDDMRHIALKPIPEPILAIYKAINGD